MRPRVIIHNAVSLDGRATGFDVDMRHYYSLVPTWKEDATLCGSGTILAAPEGRVRDEDEPGPRRKPEPGDRGPLLVVADSRGRVRCWSMLLSAGLWRDGVALCSQRTPEQHIEYLRRRRVSRIVAGERRVDLARALERLRARYRVRTVRVDSGGTLNGVLLRDGLVDEVSLLVHPKVAGTSARPLFDSPKPLRTGFKLYRQQRLPGGLVWLRYQVAR
jgi:2,5-diamino-6-(ribosylamino)-4(3H)-pyrimidinone 5'-phosphate reductase